MNTNIVNLDFFPDKFAVGGVLVRTDQSPVKIYLNIGTFAVPLFEQIGASSTPTGAIIAHGGILAEIPGGFLLCDGAAVSETTEADLFAVIGYGFGNPGGGNFNLPDLRAIFPRGAPNATEPGGTGGTNAHTLITSEMPSHNHSITVQSGVRPTADGQFAGPSTAPSVTGSAGGGGSHENKPPFLNCLFIIKR